MLIQTMLVIKLNVFNESNNQHSQYKWSSERLEQRVFQCYKIEKLLHPTLCDFNSALFILIECRLLNRKLNKINGSVNLISLKRDKLLVTLLLRGNDYPVEAPMPFTFMFNDG